jgi:hypothetical protein
VRFADIAPALHEDAAHAHCGAEDVKSGMDGGGEEEAEEASPRSAAGLGSAVTTVEDVRALRVKLETLLRESGLKVDLNLEIF